MQFNIKKIKLIYFYFKKSINLKNEIYSVKIEESIIQSKNLIK